VIARGRDVGGWPGSGEGWRGSWPAARSPGQRAVILGACQRCRVLSLRRCTRKRTGSSRSRLEVDVASQGHTIDEALANLAEVVGLYLEEVDDPAGHITAAPPVTSFQLPAA
jgi:hypothetical protein